MSRADVIRMAKEAGATALLEPTVDFLSNFAALAAAAEREACAKQCEVLGKEMLQGGKLQAVAVSGRIAAAIRARTTTKEPS